MDISTRKKEIVSDFFLMYETNLNILCQDVSEENKCIQKYYFWKEGTKCGINIKVKYHSALERKEILTHAVAWKNLEDCIVVNL